MVTLGLNNQVSIHLDPQIHNTGMEDLLAVSSRDKVQMTKQVPGENFVTHKYFIVCPDGYFTSCCEHVLSSI